MRTDILAGGVIGAIVGGFLGFLGSHAVESKRYMRKLEIEVSKIRASYEKKETADKPKEEPTSEPAKEGVNKKESESKPDDKEDNQYRDKVSIYEGSLNKDKEEQIDYSSYSTPPKEDKPVKTKKKKVVDENAPYQISDVDYHETCYEFEKVVATWFSESHMLVQSDETELDVDATIGLENLSEWPEDGVLYVRNEALGADFEVTFVDGRYDYDLD